MPGYLIRYVELPDGYKAAVRIWAHEKPRARLFFLHGIVSHGGWYLPSCNHLNAAGYEIHFLDRRGSGLNLRARGDTPSWRTWVDDVGFYAGRFSQEVPNILLGISWGGKLAPVVTAILPQLFDAVALICPGIFARQLPGPIKRSVLRLLNLLGFGSLYVPIPLRDPTLFTNQPCWQNMIACDPLCLWHVTIRFACEDIKLTKLARKVGSSVHQPAALVLAGNDRICQNEAIRDYFLSFASSSKTVFFYSDAAHTLEFDRHFPQYCRDLTDWIDTVVKVCK